ncbi:MAG TPA: hypothetical protein ENK62_00900 [Chromatiales bacterium]|nr:hypothetical protein [Chromatiales bacterium]
MSEQNETVTLSLQQSAKLGVVHVAVTEDGSVVVAGEMRRLDDGETHWFERSGIEVHRQGDQWTFTKRLGARAA